MSLINLLPKRETVQITSFSNGKIIRLENIPDPVFANRLIGDGLALEIDTLDIYAPCDGTIETIASTKHAFVLSLKNGAQLLVHIGLYQDKPYSSYFYYNTKEKDYVSKGSLILKIDKKLLDINNGKIIIPIVVLNYKEHLVTSFITSKYTKKGKVLFKIK